MNNLERLFSWHGIAANYFNYRGEYTHVSESNRRNLLEAMGVDLSNDDTVLKGLKQLDQGLWNSWLDTLIVVCEADKVSLTLRIAEANLNQYFSWRVLDNTGLLIENGDFKPSELTGNDSDVYIDELGLRYFTKTLNIPYLTPEYYRVELTSGGRVDEAQLAVTPETAYQPGWSEADERVWGTIIQLYTLKSDHNWGIGDFSDLQNLLRGAASFGVDVIGLNPLHALSTELSHSFSPYSPSDRRYLSPLYISVTSVSEYDTTMLSANLNAKRKQLSLATMVDYAGVRDIKYPVLEKMFCAFLDNELIANTPRGRSFLHWVERAGASLIAFATYEAKLQRWVGAKYIIDPSKNLTITLSAIPESGLNHDSDHASLLFHCYLQWVADEQLSDCQALSCELGMKVGLIRDLAVGADGSGSEVSSNTRLFCRDASVGAPPDPLAQLGQNWGVPPLSPMKLVKTGFAHYIELLRSNMRNCGALRIDHAMSLMRLWWCPPSHSADYGGYVYYPFNEMLGLLKLESQLNKCVVIGEDLGVVPDEFREALGRAKIFSNKVFYFEKESDNVFKPPQNYAPHAFAMVNNHDVPTLVSWWNSTDLELRDTLKLLEDGVAYSHICDQRRKEKENLMSLLYQAGLYPDSWHGQCVDEAADMPLIAAILQFASRSASKIFVIQLEDILLMDDPVNVPGTFREHPNWQRKLSATVQDVFSSGVIGDVLERINRERKKQNR